VLPPSRRRFAGAVLACALVLTACSSATDPGTVATTTITRSPSVPAPATSAPAPPTPAQLRAIAKARIAKLLAPEPEGAASYAAWNTKSGARFSGGQTAGMWTASAYKLFLLETLLLHGSSYSDSDAVAAIENSDNAAGYRLFLDAGSQSGMASAFRSFGMTHTVPGSSDPTFTTTGAPDCMKLLHNLVSPGVFGKGQRNYVLGLMRDVEADQRWGVGAAADKGTDFANKNGWLSIDDSNGPGETDHGLWAVTSLGVVTIGGDQVLMAVLTKHQPDMATGVHLVENLAKAMAPAVSG
jgi:beta-lactamase class A